MMTTIQTAERRRRPAPFPVLPVFVYGTLRTGQGNYTWALSGKTVTERPAILTAALMWDRGGFPFCEMPADATDSDTVLGEVMDIQPDQWAAVMADLDGLEGYDPKEAENFYDRKIVTVTTLDGEQVQAYVYIVGQMFAKDVRSLPPVPSGDWVTHATAKRAINLAAPKVDLPNRPVFIYGNLQSGTSTHQSSGLDEYDPQVAVATASGLTLGTAGQAVFAQVSDAESDTVRGQVWTVHNYDLQSLLDDLDDLLCFSPEEGVQVYERQVRFVTLETGEQVAAYVYLGGRDIDALPADYLLVP